MRTLMSHAALALTFTIGAEASAQDGFFLVLPDMSFARYTAAAALLNDGSVPVYGPSYNGDTFDPRSNTFGATSLIPGPRFAAKLVALPDSGALLVGGSSNDARTVLYDAAARSWTWGPPMTTARAYAQVSLLADGRVLVAGGYGNNGVPLDSAEIYDPETDAFSPTGSMPAPRQGGIAELLPNGDVLVAGGIGLSGYGDPYAAIYSVDTGTFAGGPAFYAAPQGLYMPASARLPDGGVLVSGGCVFTGPGSQRVSNDAEVFDPTTHRWTALLATARAEHTLTSLADGSVLVIGGRDDWGQPIAQTEVFDPNTDTFRNGPVLNVPRFGHTATALPGGRILIAGGQVGGNEWTASAELYQADELLSDGFER